MLMFSHHYHPGKYQPLPPLVVGGNNPNFTTLPGAVKRGVVPLLLRSKGLTPTLRG